LISSYNTDSMTIGSYNANVKVYLEDEVLEEKNVGFKVLDGDYVKPVSDVKKEEESNSSLLIGILVVIIVLLVGLFIFYLIIRGM
jgi:hypothetical protein